MSRRLKLLWGFPIAVSKGDLHPDDEATRQVVGPEQGLQGQRGVSLVIAIMIVSVMMLFTTDLIVNSQVNVRLATANRDNLKAEYMAKAAFNFISLFVSADLAFKLTKIQMMGSAAKNGQVIDSFQDPVFALNAFPPIGGETAEMMNSFQEALGLNAVMDSGILEQLKVFDGTFSFKIEDEGRKINVNFFHQGRGTELLMMLESLLSCPAEKAFLEQKKVTPRELAARIKDYIDFKTDADESSGFNDEDEPYLRREPRQRAKNAPLDSLDELKLIEGWDEEVHQVFSPYLTIWPFQADQDKRSFMPLNVNTSSRAMLQCLIPESRGDCQEKVALFFKKREEESLVVGGEGKKMVDVLRETLCYSGGEGTTDRAAWFTQMSNVFRIETIGTVGEAQKRLTAVVERVVPDPQKKEKGSNKLLFWKMN